MANFIQILLTYHSYDGSLTLKITEKEKDEIDEVSELKYTESQYV